MTWKTEVQKVLFDASQDVKSRVSMLSSFFESQLNHNAAEIYSLMNGSSVVGINVHEIPNMRSAIRIYVQDLERHLDEVATNADTSPAFKGEYADAITSYVTAITRACKSVTTQLLAFSDQLKEVSDSYEAQDRTLSENIRRSATGAEEQYQRYEEKY